MISCFHFVSDAEEFLAVVAGLHWLLTDLNEPTKSHTPPHHQHKPGILTAGFPAYVFFTLLPHYAAKPQSKAEGHLSARPCPRAVMYGVVLRDLEN
jgi:hypothetical protein